MDPLAAFLAYVVLASLYGLLLVPVGLAGAWLVRRGSWVTRLALLLVAGWGFPLALVASFARRGEPMLAPRWTGEWAGWSPVGFALASLVLLSVGRGHRKPIGCFVGANVPMVVSSLFVASMAATDSWL